MDDFYRSVISHYFSAPEIGVLRATTIGIAGCGGLGSNCAVHLARSGFERFVLADFDRVEASNLNRQAYHCGHVGRLKTECLSEIVRSINPGASIEIHSERIEASNARAVFGACDVVVEAFDRPECKAMLIETFAGSPKLVVGVSGLGGFGNGDQIVTRKIGNNFYLVGDGVSGVSDRCKPYAPRVAIAAAKQADVVLSWVLGGQ